jgi:hypothetical protein
MHNIVSYIVEPQLKLYNVLFYPRLPRFFHNQGLFFANFVKVGGLAILHKKEWAKFGQSSESKVDFLRILPWPMGTYCLNMTHVIFSFSKNGNLFNFLHKKPLYN